MSNKLRLTDRHLILLSFFANKKKCSRDVVEELGIPYPTAIRYIRELINAGYLAEVGFRENNKRYLTTIRNPNTQAEFKPEVEIFFKGKLQRIDHAVAMIAPEPEVPIRDDIVALIVSLANRGILREQTQTPGGMSPSDIHLILRKIQVKLNLWSELIGVILDAPIWIDDDQIHKRLNMPNTEGFSDIISSVTRRYMAEDKGALEK